MVKQADSTEKHPRQSLNVLIGRLIDGTGTPAKKNIRVTIENGRISKMRPFSHGDVLPQDPEESFSDSTVLPPLIDSHVHLAFSGDLDRTPQPGPCRQECECLQPVIARHVQEYRRYGVLGVRDGGDPCEHALHHKYVEKEKDKMALRINVAGFAWYRAGRYGKLMGRAIHADEDPVPVIEGKTGAGVDHIKLVQSGLNSLTEFGRQTPPQFDGHTISRIFAFARKRGIGLMVHANGEAPVAAAIEGGCDSIEHGYFMGDDNLRKLADARITWVPTVIPMKAYADLSPKGSIESEVARRTLEHQLKQLSKARRFGVKVALGTDSGSPGVFHGRAVGEELNLIVSAGYTMEEAISCATLNGARLLKSDLPGHLTVGAKATFIAVESMEGMSLEPLTWLNY